MRKRIPAYTSVHPTCILHHNSWIPSSGEFHDVQFSLNSSRGEKGGGGEIRTIRLNRLHAQFYPEPYKSLIMVCVCARASSTPPPLSQTQNGTCTHISKEIECIALFRAIAYRKLWWQWLQADNFFCSSIEGKKSDFFIPTRFLPAVVEADFRTAS